MKRLLCIGLSFALAFAMSASANAAHRPHPKTKKCKHGKVFRKGKCRRVKHLLPPGSTQRPPNSVVRASLSWDGPAYFDLQVQDAQGSRAGHFSEGILNQIPNAHYSGGAGGPGPESDTFTDDLFYGGPGFIWYPSPGNRGFAFTVCDHPYGGPDPVHVHFSWIEANGIVNTSDWTVSPSSGPTATSCVTW